MGHALNVTIQDILCRFERLRGRDVLWQPGTDHAGIATQMVVERLLAQENKTDRRSMGRRSLRPPRLGVEEPFRRPITPSSCGGSAPPATGRASASPWMRGCCGRCARSSSAAQARLDLQGPAASSMGPQAAARPSPTSRCSSSARPSGRACSWYFRYPVEAIRLVRHGRHHPARDDARRYRGGGAIRTTSRYPRTGRAAGATLRWSAAASPSSPTAIPIPRRAPARSSPRRTTSTTSRSPVGTLCRWSTFLPPTARWRSATIPISSPACRAARIW